MVLPSPTEGIKRLNIHHHHGSGGGVPMCQKSAAERGVEKGVSLEAFLKVWRPLECECCEEVVGYVERSSGRVLCKPILDPSDQPTAMQKIAKLINQGEGGQTDEKTEETLSKTLETLKKGKELVKKPEVVTTNEPVAVSQPGNVVGGKDKENVIRAAAAAPTANNPLSANPVAKNTVNNPVVKNTVNNPVAKNTVNNPVTKNTVNSPARVLKQMVMKEIETDEDDTPEYFADKFIPTKLPPEEIARIQLTAREPPKPIKQMELIDACGKDTADGKREIFIPGNYTPSPLPYPESPVEFVWSKMRYSPNLLPGSRVRVTFLYAPNQYHIVSASDEQFMEDLGDRIYQYTLENKTKYWTRQLRRGPVRDEIVLALYGTDYYRARIIGVSANGVEVEFIDYGDQALVAYDKIMDISEDLFKEPIYGLKIRLLNIPEKNYQGVTVPDNIANFEGKEFVLDLVDDVIDAEPSQSGEALASLWIGEESVNEIIFNFLVKEGVIQKTRGRPRGFKIWCSKSHANQLNFMFPVPSVKAVEADVLRINPDLTKVCLDVHSYTKKYFLQSIPTWQPEPHRNMRVEISSHENGHGVANLSFSCIQLAHDWHIRRRLMSNLIKAYIIGRYRKGEGRMDKLYADIQPDKNQMFLVKYPAWRELVRYFKYMKGSKKYEDSVRRGVFADFMDKSANKYIGKWFRAAFVRVFPCCDQTQPQLALFNLIDIGRVMIIPSKYVYAITPRFLIPPQLSLNISINIDGLPQYSSNVERWLKTILKPGLSICVKVIASVADVTMVHVIVPKLSLNDFNGWETLQMKHTLRLEMQTKLKALIDKLIKTRGVRDVGAIKEECRKLLEREKLKYAQDLANNRYMYGLDRKYNVFIQGGNPLFFSTLLPNEDDNEEIVKEEQGEAPAN